MLKSLGRIINLAVKIWAVASLLILLFMVVLAVLVIRTETRTSAGQGITLKISQDQQAKVRDKTLVVVRTHNLASDQLGDWLVDVVYDPDAISVESVHCASTPRSEVICTSGILPDKVRIIGFGGIELMGGVVKLATMTLECKRSGSSTLKLEVWEFRDSSNPDPKPITVDTENSTIECSQPGPSLTSTATPTSQPTSTFTPTQTPTTTQTPRATKPTPRANCEQMRDTDYVVSEERAWFKDHCVTPVASVAGGGGLIWPATGPISSYMDAFHPLGIDIDLAGRTGAPILAATSGTVTYAGQDSGWSYGNYVTITSPDGLWTLYAHLSSVGVWSGAEVKQGQVIGYAGNTGKVETGPGSDGVHLHFEVVNNGVRVNPLAYLP